MKRRDFITAGLLMMLPGLAHASSVTGHLKVNGVVFSVFNRGVVRFSADYPLPPSITIRKHFRGRQWNVIYTGPIPRSMPLERGRYAIDTVPRDVEAGYLKVYGPEVRNN